MSKLRLLAVLGSLGLVACQSSGPPCCKSDGFMAPSKEMVWEATMQVVRDAGYTPDSDLSRADTGKVETRWKLDLQPFSGKGYREKVTVKIVELPRKENYFRLDTSVCREMNANITQPDSPIAADWDHETNNPTMENMINRRVEMFFLRNDVSPQFRRNYGMPEKKNEMRYRPEPEPEKPIFDLEPTRRDDSPGR